MPSAVAERGLVAVPAPHLFLANILKGPTLYSIATSIHALGFLFPYLSMRPSRLKMRTQSSTTRMTTKILGKFSQVILVVELRFSCSFYFILETLLRTNIVSMETTRASKQWALLLMEASITLSSQEMKIWDAT